MWTSPCDIYASQLFPIGYGYPLWIPEPNSTSGRETFIGDVGWLKDGGFHHLFNSMRDGDDPINQERNVPRDFTVFSPTHISISKAAMIMKSIIFGRSIIATKAQAELAAVA